MQLVEQERLRVIGGLHFCDRTARRDVSREVIEASLRAGQGRLGSVEWQRAQPDNLAALHGTKQTSEHPCSIPVMTTAATDGDDHPLDVVELPGGGGEEE